MRAVEAKEEEDTEVEDVEEGGNLSRKPQWSVSSATIWGTLNMNVRNGRMRQTMQ